MGLFLFVSGIFFGYLIGIVYIRYVVIGKEWTNETPLWFLVWTLFLFMMLLGGYAIYIHNNFIPNLGR